MENVSTKELDETITMLVEARAEHDRAKTIASEKNATVELLEEKLIELMEKAEKDVYISGKTRITMVSKLQVTTPKSTEDKEAFFKWLEEKHGRDAAVAYMTVNYNSLNSLFGKELEEAQQKGTAVHVPGIESPTVRKTLQVRAGK